MKKKPILTASIFLLLFGIAPTYSAEQKNSKTPPTLAIVCGLDDVLITKNWFEITKRLTQLFLKANNRLALSKLVSKSEFWKDCYKSLFHTIYINNVRMRHTDHIITYLSYKYPALTPHQEQLTNIFYEPKIISPMIRLFCILKITTNYPLFIATSKSNASLAAVKRKLDPVLKKEHEMSWKEFFNGTFSEKKADSPSKPTKLSVEYFKSLQNYLIQKKGLSPNTLIIFIDQDKRYIDTAKKAAKQYDIPLRAIQYKSMEQIQDAIYKILKQERE